MDNHDKHAKPLGFTFQYKWGKVLIHKATLEAIGYPEFYRFRLAIEEKHFAIEACEMNSQGAHRFRGFSHGYAQSSLGFLESIYNLCKWDYERTYTVYGIVLYGGKMVGFELAKADEHREAQ